MGKISLAIASSPPTSSIRLRIIPKSLAIAKSADEVSTHTADPESTKDQVVLYVLTDFDACAIFADDLDLC